MDIILLENIEKVGFKDEIVSVKNGYGRNFLIPQGKAILATKSSVKVLEEKLRQQAKKEETEITQLCPASSSTGSSRRYRHRALRALPPGSTLPGTWGQSGG